MIIILYAQSHNIINFIIAKCERPQFMPVCTTSCSTDSVPQIAGIDDDDVPVKGSTISFSCPPGLKLKGPNSATCTGNREWESDLSGLMCNNSVSDFASTESKFNGKSNNKNTIARY